MCGHLKCLISGRPFLAKGFPGDHQLNATIHIYKPLLVIVLVVDMWP